MHTSIAQTEPACIAPRPTESPAFLYLARLAPGSRRAQRGALAWLGRVGFDESDPFRVPWHRCSPQLAIALRATLAEKYAPATARRYMAALRGVVQEAWRAGLLTADRRDRVLAVPPIRGSRPPAGRALEVYEIEQLYRKASLRDRAILALLLWGGLRRAEAASLKTSTKSRGPDSMDSYIPYRDVESRIAPMLALGKGSKTRRVILPDQAAQDLEAWCQASGLDGLGMSPTGIWKAMRRLGRRAGVLFTPHDLRRTFASLSLDQGTDLATVQQAMGHSDPRTTSRYDRRGEAAQEKAARGLSRVADLCYNGCRENSRA